MSVATQIKPEKRAVNLRVDSKLLADAKAFEINLSATLEQALTATLKVEREAAWLRENKTAIEAYNADVAKRGLWNDSFRPF